MKKILTLITVILFSFSFSQGKLYIKNYSDYRLEMRISAASANNCYPYAIASMSFGPHADVEIPDFNSSGPYSTSWAVKFTPTGSPIHQTAPSGILSTISPLTRWNYSDMMTVDPNTNQSTGDPRFKMGDPSFITSCGYGDGETYVDGNFTDVFWFYIASENATFLVVQPS